MILSSVRNRYLGLWDIVLLTMAPWIAYVIRFEGVTWAANDTHTAIVYTVLVVPLKISLFVWVGLYGRLWRHANVADMAKIVQATMLTGVAGALLGILALPWSGLTPLRVPISVAFLDGFLTFIIIATPRMTIKALTTWYRSRSLTNRRALIAGAGGAGEMVLKEILSNPDLGLTPAGFVDDDRTKHHHRLGGLPVFGGLADIPEIVAKQKIDEIIIAMPRAPGHVLRNVVHAATEANVPTRTVPGLFEIVSGRVKVSALRKVEIHDLLRREPVKIDLEAVRALVQARTVLITGAGGSIGSELARQVAFLGPRRLVLLGNAENEIFEVLEELQETYPAVTLTPTIADVRDLERMRGVFAQYQPHAVFHAAAHKHVPLMEDNVAEAVTNNVLGTRNLLDCAVTWKTAHFVFISTDKAVRPANVMGATKRAAEMLVQHAAVAHQRNFVAVRFGNVLGSRGSVVPVFLRQIRAGGPVTITHPEMRRFFMTIPEAVQLVLQAGALGRGGELFALDMGEPVRILDLAADLIRLSGLEVGTDIEIRYTGVRPGERLYEEVFFHGEDVVPTTHPKVLRTRNDNLPGNLRHRAQVLIDGARNSSIDDEVRVLLRWAVPEYQPAANARRPWRSPIPTPRVPSLEGQGSFVDRRSGGDRRRDDRRSGIRQLGRLARLTGGDRRTDRERRSGIDRRAPIDETVGPEIAVVGE